MMSRCSPEDRVIICSENTKSDYKVTSLEISSHAEKLGVDCTTERHLFPIVLQGLIHPLPTNWIPCYDKKLGEFFYYNVKNGFSQWEHPIDEQYRNLILKIKNEYDGNLNEFLRSEENLDMLPLRQNRKPQLLPIKQLLKYKDEEKSATDDKIFKPDLHPSLKMKNDASPSYKKSVSFITNDFPSEKDVQFFDTGHEKRIDKIFNLNDAWSSKTVDTWRESDDFHTFDEHDRSSPEDNNKPEISPLSKNLNKKITSLKQSFNQIKSNTETQPSSNFKRLHINLRHPDSLLFSDSNHDDTTKNILSPSPSSELVSEEEESPHNVLTNITESGIDVNTVTDLQKLKARSKLSNQNSDVNKQIYRIIDTTLCSAMAEVEQNLNDKFEGKITEEIAKLKKLYRDRLESNSNNSVPNTQQQNNYEIVVKETQEKYNIFKEEIENEMKKNYTSLEELRNTYHSEINKLKESLNECLKILENEKERTKNTDHLQQRLQNLMDEKLNNVEQSLSKKMKNLETKQKNELEAFKMEKETKITQHYESFMEEYRKNSEKLWQENSRTVVLGVLNELFTREIGSDDSLFLNFKKFVVNLLKENQTKENTEHTSRKTIATQTDNAFNDEILVLKENIEEISSSIKHLTEEIPYSNRNESKKTIKQNSDEIFFNKNATKKVHPNYTSIPYKVELYKTDFSPFEEFSSHIDEELDRYRKKYLSNPKWFGYQNST
ncbi:uncharacterized protein Cep164 [Planococcus citri]|uniref:uncharacterized protein Cep164 n=1 Tax=Planococcus citri TaxID=170843 RepID=UPI0031F8B152